MSTTMRSDGGGPGAGIDTSPSEQDAAALLQALAGGAALQAERFDGDGYLDSIIEKPWGHEYRVYADPFYDIWKLFLSPGQTTSMHCHPRKETVLLCLSGRARVTFLGGEHEIGALDFVHIRKGVFHCTQALGDEPLELVEVETPRNKLDLIRAKDRYGRQGRVYETRSLDWTVHDLARFSHAWESKSRRACVHDRYRFAVRAGMDIFCRRDPGLMFIVSLSAMNAVRQSVEVLGGGPSSLARIDLSSFYFTIHPSR